MGCNGGLSSLNEYEPKKEEEEEKEEEKDFVLGMQYIAREKNFTQIKFSKQNILKNSDSTDSFVLRAWEISRSFPWRPRRKES